MLARIEHGPVLELALDRPPVNALDPDLIGKLRKALVQAAKGGPRAVVLSGREGVFSAGLDLPRFLELDRAGARLAWLELFGVLRALARSPIPVACAITGHAVAGGCALALFCDWRVMAEGDVRIGLSEVRVGVRMPQPIVAAAAHVVGARQAERLCTSAALLPAAEALRIGLVDELAPGARVRQRALEWARGTLELPAAALRKTRALARRGLAAPFRKLDEEALELFLDEWFSEETQGGLRAQVARMSGKRS
jgi:enoyl-CoA hydratase/carnithine racemase